MARKCFISFKTEDVAYKEAVQSKPGLDIIDRSLNEPIDSYDEDYIMRAIREKYLSESTVTIHLIGIKSAENLGQEEQKYIKRELQASLFNGEGNSRSGIVGVVLPEVRHMIYGGSVVCQVCGNNISIINLDDNTTIKEFYMNYHIPHGKCHWNEDDRYCVLVYWDDFIDNPEKYIEQAFAKRSHPIAGKTRVRL